MVARAADVSEMYERICICRERERVREQSKAKHNTAKQTKCSLSVVCYSLFPSCLAVVVFVAMAKCLTIEKNSF